MASEKMRLIDANALKVKGFADHDTGEGIVFVQDINEAPTVDAVEVVRCKDCEWYNTNNCGDGFGWCEHFNAGMMNGHYCYFGRIKNNG